MSPVSWQTRNVVSFFFLLFAMVANSPSHVFVRQKSDAYYAKRMRFWLAHFRVSTTFGGLRNQRALVCIQFRPWSFLWRFLGFSERIRASLLGATVTSGPQPFENGGNGRGGALGVWGAQLTLEKAGDFQARDHRGLGRVGRYFW